MPPDNNEERIKTMTENEAIHICRNPYGHSASQCKQAKLTVCTRLESWKDAYENMRKFAEDNGLNMTCQGPR